MIYRKLIKQGNSAYTITLPIDWIKENNLDDDSSVELEINNQDLIVSTSNKDKIKSISCDVTKLRRSQIFQIVLSYYVKGFDVIEIKHKNSKAILGIEKELTGMILEEHTGNFSKFVSVIEETSSSDLLNKIMFHLKYIVENISELDFEDLRVREKLMDKLILFQIRNLHKYSNLNKDYQNLLFCFVIDTIGDFLLEIKENETKNSKYNYDLVRKNVLVYIDSIMKNDIESLILNLREFRNSVKKKTFQDGLVYSLAEFMYNFIGYFQK